jgi:SNF2 family DNA or RNA helicase
MTSATLPPDPLGWRLEVQEALAQPDLAAFDRGEDTAAARRAAYRLAAALGHCRLFGVDLGELDGSLDVAVGLGAAVQWEEYLRDWVEDAECLGRRWEQASEEIEALDFTLDLLIARMEAWAVFVAIDEAYQSCLETADPKRVPFATVLDESFVALDRFDKSLQEQADLLALAADTRLLENWRQALAPEYRTALPWWLDGSLEADAAHLAEQGLTWQPLRLPSVAADRNGAGQQARPDFTADAEVVRLVAEGERLAFGHQINPAFAIETALIDPLPHQRIAVYQHLLRQPRLRFLLADDAGAGKTIMAGLYIREMLARRLVRRVLIVPPAGLIGNWERELRTLFNLDFDIISGADARAANPFVGDKSDLLIVSVDTLAGKHAFGRLQEPAVEPYDLVIFDEAHKLAADRQPDFTIRKTQRYELAEALAGIPGDDERWALSWSCRHLLLLTATPHMGKDYPYYLLWRLLEPEELPTYEAFAAYPLAERQRHFLRRTKEEMVRFDGTRIYPTRHSDTLSYDLTQGPDSEQELYDRTTEYIREHYNRARFLNRSAARLAMSVFQRRLASSTYALLRSFERRLEKLDYWITGLSSGRFSLDDLRRRQQELAARGDVFDSKTAEEEESRAGREENEEEEDKALGGFTASRIAELRQERDQVTELLALARRVEAKGDKSKFDKLTDALRDRNFRNEKVLIFTEHRDTLDFLCRSLQGLGFTGEVAQIHGGMDYRERDEQAAFFRKPASEGGARFLVATDAAGEGINLQFCWLMFNYDIPWNPARLEQRMGRVHRYNQKHDPVIILNLVAGKTREGRVIKTLLDKLERIRKELRSDKVFDVIGRLFEGVSIRDYMEQALAGEGAVLEQIEGHLTEEQVTALAERERRLYSDGGDVRGLLERETARAETENWRRLLPGYVRRFVSHAAPRLGLRIEGNLDEFFALRPAGGDGPNPLRPLLASCGLLGQRPLTLTKPPGVNGHVFLRPGEPLFDRLRVHFCERFADEARRGGVFVDPYSARPYLVHLARVSVRRRADAAIPALRHEELMETQLVGLRQEEDGTLRPCPLEQLLLLKGATGVPIAGRGLAEAAVVSRGFAEAALIQTARERASARRRQLEEDLPVRLDFVTRGYDCQQVELAAARTRLVDRVEHGDARARTELERVKKRQQALKARREQALAALRRELELIEPGEVAFVAHTLVVPSDDPEDRRRHDEDVEALAVRLAGAFEQEAGAVVQDVSTPPLALAAGLTPNPGFDLLATRRGGERLAIEVKGRAGTGEVELTENEWVQACNHRHRYWLYVVFDCATPCPRLVRVQDPFGKLLVRARTRVVIAASEILDAAERETFIWASEQSALVANVS